MKDQRRVVIAADAICIEGFDEPPDDAGTTLSAVHSLRALMWAIERVLQATAQIEEETRRKEQFAAAMLKGLH